MKLWKISNASNEVVKVVISTSSNTSVGIKLQPEHFVLCAPKQTPTMDAQIRRRFITVERDFDNTEFNYEVAKTYSAVEHEVKKHVIAETKAAVTEKKND